jgi:hypothetical protein
MQWHSSIKLACGATLLAMLSFGCASDDVAPPPPKSAPLASSPAEVERALPGTWIIDAEASADALARAQYQPRPVTWLRRESDGATTHETSTVAEQFDPKAYREARRYWQDVLQKPDMKWRLVFQPNGTGEHWAVVKTGSAPEKNAFTWRLDGWRLKIDYPDAGRFRSFEVTMNSAGELHYPMAPLGDHLVLRPTGSR